MDKTEFVIRLCLMILSLWTVFLFDNIPSVILAIIIILAFSLTDKKDGGKKDE